MSYGVNSIQIHKKLRLDKRAGSDNWYARLTLPSGKRLIKTEPPHLNWSSAMFRKRRTDNDEQTTEAGRDYHEVEAS